MFPDLYNPSVPRIFIAEAHRINTEGIVKPSYLVAMVSTAMLLEWAELSNNLPAGDAGFDTWCSSANGVASASTANASLNSI